MHEPKPIARWARVPWETVDGLEQIGVVAYHKDGIKEVRYKITTGDKGPSDLSLVLSNFGQITTEGDQDGDGIVDATDLSLVLSNFGEEYEVIVNKTRVNNKTKVEEYSFDFDFSTLPEGKTVEIQATVIATDGTTVELNNPWSLDNYQIGFHSICLQKKWIPLKVYNVDQNGSDTNDGISSPFKTIAKAFSVANYGDVIELSDGEHEITVPSIKPKPKQGLGKWITVRGKGMNETVLFSKGSFRTYNKIKFENLMVDIGRSNYATNGANLWWHNCKFYSPSSEAWWADGVAKHGYPDPSIPISAKGTDASWHRDGSYFTDCHQELYCQGFGSTSMARNCSIKRIWGDAFAMAQGVYNCSVDEFYGYLTDKHSDLYQGWGDKTNVIFYGVTATKLDSVQGIFCRMVDVPMSKLPPYDPSIHQQTALWNCAFVNCLIHHIPNASNGYTNYGGPPFSQLNNKIHHVLLTNIQLPYQRLLFGGSEEEGWEHKDHKDVIVSNCDLHWKTLEDMEDPRKGWIKIDGGYERTGVKILNCFNSIPKG
jgi:hypothetical protein